MKMHVNMIMSAERPARTPAGDIENVKRTNELHDLLHKRGITFVPSRGFYNGVEERSVCVLVDDSDDYDWLLETAQHFQQESVLVVDANKVARLVYMAGGIKRIGMMEKVPEHIARSRPGWTRIRRPMDVFEPFDYWAVNHDGTPDTESYYLGEAKRLGAVPEQVH